MMDGRFLIYNGFENDVYTIFKELIEKFNFKIVRTSDCGVQFENTRCNLKIEYETGLQLWLSIPKYNISEMISVLCMFKKEKVFSEYRRISLLKEINDELSELSHFLCANFEDELSE